MWIRSVYRGKRFRYQSTVFKEHITGHQAPALICLCGSLRDPVPDERSCCIVFHGPKASDHVFFLSGTAKKAINVAHVNCSRLRHQGLVGSCSDTLFRRKLSKPAMAGHGVLRHIGRAADRKKLSFTHQFFPPRAMLVLVAVAIAVIFVAISVAVVLFVFDIGVVHDRTDDACTHGMQGIHG